MIGFTTVPEGQRVLVWNKRGQARGVDGPRRLFLVGERVEPLKRFAAEPDQYLVVKSKDGTTEHLRGPIAVWFDPVRHLEITIESVLHIDAHEAVVVYRQLPAGAVDRRVVRGPALFVPQAEEWLHQFRWHGAAPHDPHQKVPRALQFTKLRVIPDQMYFDVESVRTADDALLVVKLMIFFELHDIEKMLDQTHDPVADFINAVSADVIDFAAVVDFEKFKERTEALNRLETYRQLTQRAERIGYRINKVVYRGYYASDKLQAMHDSAIEVRTKLRLESETEEQAQQLADMKLTREAERTARRQHLEEAQITHDNRLKRLAHEEKLQQQQAEQLREHENRRQQNLIELEHQQAMNREQTTFLQSMQELQIDLTRYLVAQYQNPDKVIRIDAAQTPKLHLHEG